VAPCFWLQNRSSHCNTRTYVKKHPPRLVGPVLKKSSTGSKLLDELGGISISSRHLNNLTVKIGAELAEDRDARTAAYFDQPLPRVPHRAEMPISLATVSIDGGRMQTRLDGASVGVHDPHWRETKNALFLRMSGVAFQEDPHPELPECFVDRHGMKTLLPGVEPPQGEHNGDRHSVSETRREHSRWKFWNDGVSGEAILQVRAAALCDDDRLHHHLQNRPGNPFRPNARHVPPSKHQRQLKKCVPAPRRTSGISPSDYWTTSTAKRWSGEQCPIVNCSGGLVSGG